MKRIAAIDIGTNTAMLLLAQVMNGEIEPLHDEERIVRLGEGVDQDGKLKQPAVARVLTALEDYMALSRRFQTDAVIVSGTSAVRDAGNRQVLLDEIKNRFGVEMLLLTGMEEARWTYFGALANKKELSGRILLIDIGGGSTEFIFGNREQIQNALSLDIGSVRLTERLVRHDPIRAEEYQGLVQVLRQQLSEAFREWQIEPEHFVGVAGTVTTLAAMKLQMSNYDPARVDGSQLSLQHVEKVVTRLRGSTLQERQQMPGLKPDRADVILSGAVILQEVMKFFGVDRVVVSDWGLRHGLVLKFLQEQQIR